MELKSGSASLTFNEKVYLAIFIFVQYLRNKSNDDCLCLPFIKNCSAIQFAAEVFRDDSALIANDFYSESSLEKPTLFCKHLENAAKSIFQIHIQHLRFKQSRGLYTNHDELAMADDFNFLVRYCCSHKSLIRNLA